MIIEEQLKHSISIKKHKKATLIISNEAYFRTKKDLMRHESNFILYVLYSIGNFQIILSIVL